MKNLKNHVKIELGILGVIGVLLLIFTLFMRKNANAYEEELNNFDLTMTEKELDVEDFNKLYGMTQLEIEVLEGEPKVFVKAPKGMIDDIELEQNGKSLFVRQSNSNRSLSEDIAAQSYIQVYYDDLEYINSTRNCRMVVKDTLKGGFIRLSTDGNSRLEVPVVMEELEIKTDGNSKIRVEGRVNELSANVSGNSKMHTQNCVANNVELESYGNSEVKVRSEMKIRAQASGNSRVFVEGTPEQVETNTSQNGKLKMVN